MNCVELHVHRDAPDKPPVGARCNGCGVCCSLSPCPLSRVLLGHRTGVCPALEWLADGSRRYTCGLAVRPAQYLSWWPRSATGLEPLGRWLVLRWISAGSGCDCDAAPSE